MARASRPAPTSVSSPAAPILAARSPCSGACPVERARELGLPEDRRGSCPGLGPQLGFIIPLSTTTQAYLNLKGYKEFASQNRPDPAGRLGLETIAESSLSGKARRNPGISGGEPGSTPGSRHGVGDLFTALRRQG